jgi:hypothetical protein
MKLCNCNIRVSLSSSVRKIRNGNAGNLGTYPILSVLPDKFARFLFEFQCFRFESLDIPHLPGDRSYFDDKMDVQEARVDEKVHQIMSYLLLVLFVSQCFSYDYNYNYLHDHFFREV